MVELRNATLVFLIKKEGRDIKEICLAIKKRGFGVGKWNGIGGKQETNETIEETAKRETKEEIFVDIKDIIKVGELEFYFIDKPEFNQKVHVYLTEKWIGEPKESEEMKPAWFKVEAIPFNTMWVDDPLWLPLVLSGKKIKGKFSFGDNNKLIAKNVVIL